MSNKAEQLEPIPPALKLHHGSALAGASLNALKLPEDVSFAVAGGKGAQVWDAAGNKYYDYLMGSGPMLLGHAHPRVVEAIQRQAALGTHYYYVNERAIELAERVRALVPCAEQVRYCSDGSEATFYAMRLARAFTGRSKILKFDGAFHGHHDYARQRAASNSANQPFAEAESAGVPEVIGGTVLIAPFNDTTATREIALGWAEDIAAIIVEPVQRDIVPKPDFLAGLRRLADEIGAILIFDEVVTGFRLALGGAQQLFGVTPDLCSLGKAIGGGTPLAAVAGRADIMELADPGRKDDGRSIYMSGTLNGNPLGCAAGLATLQVIEDEDLPSKLRDKGEVLRSELSRVAKTLSIEFYAGGAPSILQPTFGAGPVETSSDYKGTNPAAGKAFGIELIRRGILVFPGSKLYLSIAHDDASQDAFLAAARDAMRAVRDAGLLD